MNTHLLSRSRITGTVTCGDCGLLPLDDEDLDTLCESEPGIKRYLMEHGNLRVPCSPYGHDTATCADIAYPVIDILRHETGEPVTFEGIDHVMGLVVNGHSDPGYLIVNYGTEYGYSPEDYLDDPETYKGDDTD